MAITTKRYVVYDLSQERNVRTDSQNDEVAFKSISVGGLSGPVISESGGEIDVSGVKIHNLGYPTHSDDAATKDYVDNIAQGLTIKGSVATTTLPEDFTEDTPVSEDTDITFPAGSSIDPSDYWFYYSAGSTPKKVIVWYTVDASGNLPTNVRYDQSIEVDIGSSNTPNDVAGATATAINGAGYGATSLNSTSPMTLRITNGGDVLPVIDGNLGTTASISTKGMGFWRYGTGNTLVTSLGSSPVATTISSSNAVVTSAAHGMYVGDKVELDGVTPFNGLDDSDLNGEKTITAVTLNTFTFNAGTPATATGSGGGSSARTMYRSLMTLRGLVSGPKFDGYTLSTNDRLLIKDMPTAERPFNGIFYVYSVPSVTSLVLSRTADADNQPNGGEVVGGMFTFVDAGDTYADSGWVMSSPHGQATLGTDNLIFAQFSAAGVIQAGDGLEKVGNILNVLPGLGIKIDVGNTVAVKLTGATLTTTSLGLKVAANGITETELNASVAGNGLTGGGGSPLAVGAGSGITVGSDSVSLASTAAGDGLTYSVGVLDVGAGDGISVGSDTVSLASTTAGDGLSYSSGVLSVNVGTALSLTSDTINVDAGDGITLVSDRVEIDPNIAGNGLTYTSGVLDVVAGDGITVGSDSVSLSSSVAGDGLSYTSGVLAINAGDGLSLVSDNLIFNAGDGLTIVSDIVNVLAADPTITVNSSGIKIGTPTLGSSGQYLKTDGSGNVEWGTVASTLQDAYDNDPDGGDAIITTNSIDGNVVIAGTESLKITATNGLDMTNKSIRTSTVNGAITIIPNGTGQIKIGNGASASGDNSVAIGRDAVTGDNDSVAIGTAATTSGGSINQLAIGYGALAYAGFAAALGNNTYAQALGSTAIGYNSHANAQYSVAIGPGSYTAATGDLTVGSGDGSSSSESTNRLKLEAVNENVHIGRYVNQAAVSGAANILKIHTTNASNQSQYIGFRAKTDLTSSTTYIFPTDGSSNQFLKTDGAGNLSWSSTAGSLGLNDLTDVTLTSSASGDILQFNGSEWVNNPLNLDTYNYTTKLDSTGPAAGMLAVRYDEPMVNDEGSFVAEGLVVYENDEGKVSLCNAADTFLGDGTTFGITLTAASSGSSIDIYTRPGALIHGTLTSGVLTAGFKIAPLALGNNPITSVLSSSVVTVTTPAAHGLVNGDVVTLASLASFNGITTGGLNGDKTITVSNPSEFTFDTGDIATAGGSGGGSSGTWQRHRLLQNKPVYLSKLDGYLTQDVSSFISGDSIVRIGYVKTAAVLQFAPMYEIYL